MAVCQELEIENQIIPRIAYGFAGGIGNTGAVCGAINGAVMAIGLKIDKADTMKEALNQLAVVQDFRRRIEGEIGTIICRELTGADLTTEDGVRQFMSSDTPRKVCFPAVGLAYRIAVDLLK